MTMMISCEFIQLTVVIDVIGKGKKSATLTHDTSKLLSKGMYSGSRYLRIIASSLFRAASCM